MQWNPPSLEQVSNDMVEAGARTRDANKKGRSIYPDGQKENFEWLEKQGNVDAIWHDSPPFGKIGYGCITQVYFVYAMTS